MELKLMVSMGAGKYSPPLKWKSFARHFCTVLLWGCMLTISALMVYNLISVRTLWGGPPSVFFCGLASDCSRSYFLWLDGELSAEGGGEAVLYNVAERQLAYQSSSGQGERGYAENAVDGNEDGNIMHGSCTHTADNTGGIEGSTDPWWRVDLGQTVPVVSVEIWNRTDCCGERLQGVEVWVSNTSSSYSSGTECHGGDEASPTEPGRSFKRRCNLSGRHVWVRLGGPNRILSLCEVKVWSTAKPGKVPDPCFDESIMTQRIDFSDTSVKYLFYDRTLDWCAGASHKSWSYSCAAGEAIALKRKFVLDYEWCLHPAHTGLPTAIVKDVRLYYSGQVLRNNKHIVPLSAFKCALAEWKKKHPEGPTTKEVFSPAKAPFTKDLVGEESMVIHRHFGSDYPYWFDVCAHNVEIQRPWNLLQMNEALAHITNDIKGAMRWDYDVVHVRRGDKAKNKILWPNLDNDTQPDQLLAKIPKFIPPGRNLYIATNEKAPGFFDPLATKYKTFILPQFSYLWGPGSHWYNVTEKFATHDNRPDFLDFDAYLEGLVDMSLINGGKKKVETFNDLTKDRRHGVGVGCSPEDPC